MDILLVEDNPGDVRLAQECFRIAEPPINLHIARNGVEAMPSCVARETTCTPLDRTSFVGFELAQNGWSAGARRNQKRCRPELNSNNYSYLVRTDDRY